MFDLFRSADAYLKESDWKDLALVKCCLFSMGVLMGLRVPLHKTLTTRKWARCGFWLTYVPLMAKYARVVLKMKQQ